MTAEHTPPTAAQFRKKPVVIEAMQFRAYTEALPPETWNDNQGGSLWQWMQEGGRACVCCQDVDTEPAYALIPTLEGVMRAEIGDWIIKGVAGEFYPCKPDIFEATYEPAGLLRPDTPPPSAAHVSSGFANLPDLFDGEGNWVSPSRITAALVAGSDTPPPSERSSDALRIDMVHELCTALHGNSWARPDPPAAFWRQLLNEVEHLVGGLVAGSDDSTDTLIERMESLATEIETPMRCTSPAYGAPGVDHCAACCGGTRYVVTCAEDQAMLDAASALNAAVRLVRAAPASQPKKEQ